LGKRQENRKRPWVTKWQRSTIGEKHEIDKINLQHLVKTRKGTLDGKYREGGE
jgi:hypothetical protein